jgi:phage terminase large subunit-like protein
MGTLVVPALDAEPWPTLGGQVADWIEEYLVHGPGDLRGQPYRLDDEKRALLYRMYEVFPIGHPNAGRRRFRRVGVSLRKGSAKTEFAACIAAAELHPDAPVRCDGFDAHRQPVGIGVRDPYIPLVAYTEEQSEELAYGALRVILEEGPLADDFDIGLERIMRKAGDGKAVALSSSPDSRDGARTTFQHFDETHRFVLPRLKEAHRTMLANLPKRRLADPWALETTTAPAPGEASVAEATMDYARAVQSGTITDSRLFFFHREASDKHDLTTRQGVKDAVLEASGPIAEWSDVDGICEQFDDPTADRPYLERVWLNRLVQRGERAFDTEVWKGLAEPERTIPDREHIVLGFDGSLTKDATAIVATHVATGFQWLVDVWQRPQRVDNWQVPVEEVGRVLDETFKRWRVWRLYADPFYWETHVASWAGKYGDDKVMEWRTNRDRPMALALRAWEEAVKTGQLRHNGDARLTEHVGNAVRRDLHGLDDDGKKLWVIQKERPDSPHKIDACMASVLSWEARTDALAKGIAKAGDSVYKRRGALIL